MWQCKGMRNENSSYQKSGINDTNISKKMITMKTTKKLRHVFAALLILASLFLSHPALTQQGGYALKFAPAWPWSGNPYVQTNYGGAIKTIEFWFRTNSFNPLYGICGQRYDDVEEQGNWQMHWENVAPYKKLRIFGNNPTGFEFVTSTTFDPGKWYHVAVTSSGSAMQYYVNGVLEKTLSTTFIMGASPNDDNLVFGGSFGNHTIYPFDGDMDEVRVWSVVRTADEIKANMYKELAGTETNLVAYYKMSDGAGTTVTDNQSSHTYTGTIHNGAEWKASGCFAGPRYALVLSQGTEIEDHEYIDVPDAASLDLTTNYTLEAWIKVQEFSKYGGIISKDYTAANNAYTLRLGENSPYNYINFDGMEASGLSLQTDTWYHVAAVNDGGTRYLYINGVSQTLTGSAITPVATTGLLTIGADWYQSVLPHYFHGKLDEVRIWNVARTASQIREGMMATLGGNETGLVLYYRMDYPSSMILVSPTIHDISSYGNNGTFHYSEDYFNVWATSDIFNTWIGSESGTWATATNWSTGAAPVSTNNIGLYKWTDLGNEATLSGSPTVNHLMVSSTATPVLSSAFTVSGTALLEGDMSLYGSSALNTAASLVIGSGATLTIPYDGRLTVSGTLTNSGNLTIASTASGTGSLINSTAGISATVQRYVGGWGDANHGWHFLSSPIASQAIGSGFTAEPATSYDFYCWYEPSNMWVNYKNMSGGGGTAPFFDVVNGSSNFTVGKGYLAAYQTAATRSFSGTLNTANVSVTDLTISSGTNQGWHLLGNPYPSALTWYSGWTVSNIAATAKIWNETGAAYSDIASGGVIPAMNGFMVQVSSGTGSLTIPNASRTHSATAWYKSTDDPTILLVARDPAGNTAQESILRFNDQASPGYDPMFDSRFLPGYAPLFYSVAGEEHLSTNTLPSINGSVQIPFTFIKNEGTSFTIEAEKITDITGPVILNDLLTGSAQDLTLNPIYGFTASSSDNPARFLLTFNPVGIDDPDFSTTRQLPIHCWDQDKTIAISNPEQLDGTIEVVNMTGQTVLRANLENITKQTISHQLGAGIYVVQVNAAGKVKNQKIIVR